MREIHVGFPGDMRLPASIDFVNYSNEDIGFDPSSSDSNGMTSDSRSLEIGEQLLPSLPERMMLKPSPYRIPQAWIFSRKR